MSIAQVTNIKQHLDKIFGENQGFWEYKTIDGEFICYTVRTQDRTTGKKLVKPWIMQDGKLVNKFHAGQKERPLYNLPLLKKDPDKPILIVEGEKTADAGAILLPEFNTITWMGGCQQAKNVDFNVLDKKVVYLLPDNDENGYKAMELILAKLQGVASKVHFVDIKNLGLSEHWDIADLLDTEYGEIALDDAVDFIRSAKQYTYPSLSTIDKSDFPLRSEKGNPINAYENLEYLLNHYKMTTRYNQIKKDVEVDIPHKDFNRSNKSNLILAEITGLCIKNGVPRADIAQWMLMIADNNSYNPVKEYITSVPWDGVTRMGDFMSTLECHDNTIRDMLVYRWMIGAVAVGLSTDGLAHPGVLTLLGPQYCGKSSWFLSLLPPNSDLCLGDFGLNPADKDSVRTATRFWLTELSEVDGAVRKSDVSAMKSFLTRKLDVYRCPYDRADTEAPRNTAFVATVNDDKFLRDTSGNRRWWIVDVIRANAHHGLNMQQVWAEFHHYYLKGETFYLSKEEFNILTSNNEHHTVASSIEEIIRERYLWEEPVYRKCSATQVLFECDIPSKGGATTEIKECHRVLKLISDQKPKIVKGVSVYLLPRLNPRYQMPD